MTINHLSKLWDSESDKYKLRTGTLNTYPLPHLFLPRAGESVLDAGCGAGTWLGLYHELAKSVIGLDFSSAMLSIAVQRGPVIQGDVQTLPFAVKSFDYVSSFLCINHVPNPDSALAELARVTKTNGRIVLLVPNQLSFYTPLRTLAMHLHLYSLGFSAHYTAGSLAQAAAAVGLQLAHTVAISKPVSGTRWMRNSAAFLAYLLDQSICRLYPLWGGDLAALLIKVK